MRTAAALVVLLAVALPADAQRTVAITIDDLPFVSRDRSLATAQQGTTRLLQALREARVPAIGFVNESKVHIVGERDARAALLQQWIDAGMSLGNHTYTHADFNKQSAQWFADDVIHGEVVWRPMMEKASRRELWLRHPFLHTGGDAGKRAAFEGFLASRGYRVAPVTLEHSDWWFASLYDRLQAQGDPAGAAKVREASLAYLDTMLDYHEGLTRRLFGRDIAHVFLMHANTLNSQIMGEMLQRFRRRGYRFVALGEAMQDAAYRTEDHYQGTDGMVWQHRWGIALGHKSGPADEPEIPSWLVQLDKATPR
ncbi:MAG: polysaccharide deacetylase family protein [Bryobacterales bacterium]|nr:polysaccharide deacetylase family protein [Bryobacterales bacterium]